MFVISFFSHQVSYFVRNTPLSYFNLEEWILWRASISVKLYGQSQLSLRVTPWLVRVPIHNNTENFWCLQVIVLYHLIDFRYSLTTKVAIVNIRAEMNRIIKQWYSATFCLVGLYWKLWSQQSFSGFAYLCHSPSLVHSLDSGRKLSPIRPKQTRFLVTFLNSPFTRREFLAFLWAEFYLWAAFSFSSTSSSTAYGRYTLFLENVCMLNSRYIANYGRMI